jgi:hypothetical protein
MRVLAVTDAERWFNHHVIGSLVDQGHHVEVFTCGAGAGDFYGRARHQERLSKNQALLDHAKHMLSEGGLDLIFCFVYDDFLTVEYARKLERLGVPMVNYNVDMANQWYRQIRIAPYFTTMLCAQRINMDSMARYGRVLYFPMAARPPIMEVHSDFVPSAPVTFVGSPMDYRIRVLARVQQSGIPLAIYGNLWNEGRVLRVRSGAAKTISDIYHYIWPRLRTEGWRPLSRTLTKRFRRERPGSPESLSSTSKHGPVPDAALDDLFRNSKVNLGITRMIGEDPDRPGVNQVKLRDFEVPFAGGFYLVEEAEDHAELFKIGSEIETWHNPDELIDKIRYYSKHEGRRVAVAEAGRKRALAEHTWNSRFDFLFRTLGLTSSSGIWTIGKSDDVP